jgi:hypothetical protein
MLAKRLYLPLTLLLLAALACSGNATQAPAPIPSVDGVVKGFGISPEGWPQDYSRLEDFLAEVGEIPNGGVMFNGGWRDDLLEGRDAGQIPETAEGITRRASEFGYVPIHVFGWRSQGNIVHLAVPDNPTNDWSNEAAKALYEQMLVDFAQTYQPPYIFIGNESDEYYIEHPEDYARWIEFYNRAYDAIKAVAPDTRVGPIFQYERMAGIGQINNWTQAHWGAVNCHDLNRVDIIGLTIYPMFSAATPQEIPDDYLSPILERIGDTPIAITETGWPADYFGDRELPWQASPEMQVAYIEALDRILEGVNVEILNWAFLYPLGQGEDAGLVWELFGPLALYDRAGNPRPALAAWMDFLP